MTTSSVHPAHIIAAAAYIVGYPVLQQLFIQLEVFDFIIPDYSLFDLMGVRTPRGLSLEQTLAVATCRAGPHCAVAGFAVYFVPLAIVWGGVPKLFDGPTFASATHPAAPKFVHFAMCLVLVWVVDRYVVIPLLGSGGAFDYGERWRYLPMLAFQLHLGYFVAACLATRHSIRVRDWRDPGELFNAVLAGDAQALLKHLSAGFDPNVVRDEDGATPLHVAAGAGEPEVVITLLAGNAEPQVRDHTGATPLHVAAAAGDYGAIVALVDEDVDVDGRDNEGATPLHHAAANGHADAVGCLLDFEADPNLQNNAAQSVLDVWTAHGDDADVLARLREAQRQGTSS